MVRRQRAGLVDHARAVPAILVGAVQSFLQLSPWALPCAGPYSDALSLGLVLDRCHAILLTAAALPAHGIRLWRRPVHLGQFIRSGNVPSACSRPPVGATLYVASRISGRLVLSIGGPWHTLYIVAHSSR